MTKGTAGYPSSIMFGAIALRPRAPAEPPPAAAYRPPVGALAWPVIGEQMLQTLVGVVDIAMVGRLGPAAVAGVGTGNQLLQVAMSAMAAVSVGTTVLVARSTG